MGVPQAEAWEGAAEWRVLDLEGMHGGDEMTDEEVLRWELAYEESARCDFERRIYEQCDAEDAAALEDLTLEEK